MSEELRADLELFLQGDMPPLPDVLDDGDIVPVARWVGSDLAAVRTVTQDGSDTPSDDVFLFHRGGGPDRRWDELDGSGGSEWYTTFDNWRALEPLPPSTVIWNGVLTVRDRAVTAAAIGGRAGASATAIALTQQYRLVQPLASPLGLFVVAFDPSSAWHVDVLDQDATVVASLSGTAEFFQ